MNKTHSRIRATLGALAKGTVPDALLAFAAIPGISTAQEGNRLEEVVITAQRREQNLQDVLR